MGSKKYCGDEKVVKRRWEPRKGYRGRDKVATVKRRGRWGSADGSRHWWESREGIFGEKGGSARNGGVLDKVGQEDGCLGGVEEARVEG